MRLPDAPSNYDPVYESEKNNILEKSDQQNFTLEIWKHYVSQVYRHNFGQKCH